MRQRLPALVNNRAPAAKKATPKNFWSHKRWFIATSKALQWLSSSLEAAQMLPSSPNCCDFPVTSALRIVLRQSERSDALSNAITIALIRSECPQLGGSRQARTSFHWS